MQIIGTRPNSAFRVDDQYYLQKPYQTVGIDPTTGGPVKVVEDFTDDAPPARQGFEWIVDCNPDSTSYRQVVQRETAQARRRRTQQQPQQQQQRQQQQQSQPEMVGDDDIL